MANEPTIDRKNEVICEFMDGHRMIDNTIHIYKGPDGIEWETGHYLKYHTSWDWLRPVWEKFRDLNFRGNALRRWNHENHKERIVNCLANGTIAECHEALYNGIKWYQKVNQQKQTNG